MINILAMRLGRSLVVPFNSPNERSYLHKIRSGTDDRNDFNLHSLLILTNGFYICISRGSSSWMVTRCQICIIGRILRKQLGPIIFCIQVNGILIENIGRHLLTQRRLCSQNGLNPSRIQIGPPNKAFWKRKLRCSVRPPWYY